MRNTPTSSRSLRLAVIAGLGAALVGCGGGGGGDESPYGTLELSAANRDSVAHAAASGAIAVMGTGTLPVTPGATVADRQGPLLQRVVATAARELAAGARASAAMKRPLAVIGPEIQACLYSGTMSLTLDDRDNSNSLTGGDVFTVAFNNCRDSAEDRMDGSAVVTFTSVNAQLTAFTGRMALSQLAMATPNHSVAISGTMGIDFAELSASTQRMRMTAEGAVVANVQTHVFSDTVTLQSGFTAESVLDRSAAPPGNPFAPGRDTITLNGKIESVAAGGSFSLTTGSPLIDYVVDNYPSAGALRLQGKTGTILLTPLSAQDVRIELDADGNGSFESTSTVTWDWLL